MVIWHDLSFIKCCMYTQFNELRLINQGVNARAFGRYFHLL
ncbi:hypothetical protein PMAG_a0954 [Pseudoalteromonas mariniglutinosa NCIMB 1770]|nr:hypothetical protein [Pseudoalteromonas mariniglutinosa NCIMB 1770]